MPTRRTPWLGAAQGDNPNGTAAGAMQMPAAPSMTAAPSNTPKTTPGAVNPMQTAGPAAPPMPTAPPPIVPSQPQGGGPTSPMNIGSMMQPNQPPPGPVRNPLPPWGSQPGSGPGAMPGGGDVTTGATTLSMGSATPNVGMGAADQMGDANGLNPMVMMRMLKMLGKI